MHLFIGQNHEFRILQRNVSSSRGNELVCDSLICDFFALTPQYDLDGATHDILSMQPIRG